MSRLLVDENLPPSLAALLRQAGHDAAHVNQVGLAGTEDPTIMARAMQEGRTVVTLDRDYPHLLRDGAEGPSVIRIDQRGGRAVAGLVRQAEALQAALPKLDAYLMEGASVTLDARGVRVDPLPLGSGRAAGSTPAPPIATQPRPGRRLPDRARTRPTLGRDTSQAPRPPTSPPAGRDGIPLRTPTPSGSGRDVRSRLPVRARAGWASGASAPRRSGGNRARRSIPHRRTSGGDGGEPPPAGPRPGLDPRRALADAQSIGQAEMRPAVVRLIRNSC